MAWRVVSVVVGTLAVVGFAGGMTFVIVRDRRRWHRRKASLNLAPTRPETTEPPDMVAPAEIDFVQVWLDHQWEQRFG